ncbi:hypothetical protein MJL81_31715, partial [Salmonella enterica subsp. enterica serovar Anatum]|nr:hypothetical protein [Salmonella enterica subsp. enterica serovar Anatum]
TTPSRGCTLGAAVAFIAYLLNQRYGSGDAWMYETESVITMVMAKYKNTLFASAWYVIDIGQRHRAAGKAISLRYAFPGFPFRSGT